MYFPYDIFIWHHSQSVSYAHMTCDSFDISPCQRAISHMTHKSLSMSNFPYVVICLTSDPVHELISFWVYLGKWNVNKMWIYIFFSSDLALGDCHLIGIDDVEKKDSGRDWVNMLCSMCSTFYGSSNFNKIKQKYFFVVIIIKCAKC